MKIELTNNYCSTTIARDMQIGDVAICPEVSNHFILRAYNGLVDLNNPRNTWEKTSSLRVMLLPRGTKLEITL